jgi:hypothetical protein
MIDYNRPWQVLNIDISKAIRSDFNFDNLLAHSKFVDEPAALWNFADEKLTELFDSTWLSHFDHLGFKIRNALLFYRTANYVHPVAHIDYVGNQHPVPAIYALNFVVSPNDDSSMVWFQPVNKSGSIGTDANFDNPQNHYEFWPIDQLTGCEIARRCIGNQLTLVNTGTIHNIFMGNQPRWAVSIRLTRNDQINSWEDAVNVFSPWFKQQKDQHD